MGALSKILPLLILVLVLAVLALIGFIVYTVMTDIKSHTQKKMEGKNVVFSKEGMKVGVKEVKAEDYADRTQSVLVKAWNFSSLPGYKSRFWNQEAEINKPKESRMSFSRSSSSQQSLKRTASEQGQPTSRTTTNQSTTAGRVSKQSTKNQ